MKKFEYARIQSTTDAISQLDAQLFILGQEGWELVTSFLATPNVSLSRYNFVHMILKREVE